MHRFVSACGVSISIGFMLISAAMNWSYGLALARSDFDQVLSALIAVGIDVLKVTFTFTMGWAWRHGRVSTLAISGVLVIALMCHSIVGVAGYVELARSHSSGTLLSKKDTSEDLKRALGRKQLRLEELGAYQSSTAIELQLQVQQHDRRWSATQKCTNVTVGDSRSFCAAYKILEVRSAVAFEGERLEREIQEIRQQSNALATAAAVDRGDPRAGFLSRLFGWKLLPVQTALSLLLVGLIEGVATFGIYASINHGRVDITPNQAGEAPSSTKPELSNNDPALTRPTVSSAPEFGALSRFTLDCLKPCKGRRTEIGLLYPNYLSWCASQGMHAFSTQEFARHFTSMCESVGLVTEVVDGRVYCINVATVSSDT